MKISRNKNIFYRDMKQWKKWKSLDYGSFISFCYLMLWFKEFRNVYYYRINYSKLFKWLCPPLNSLYINTKNIKEGLLIQHGFATIITAEEIGKNVHVFQQVTIGFEGDKKPVIGDNVTICAGAKVIGGVRIGNDVTVGANAVVVKDVPDGCVVVGVPARIIKQYGKTI